MNKQFVSIALTALALGGCAKRSPHPKDVETVQPQICYPLYPSPPCDPDIICTAVYADIQVTVKDNKGNNIVLDSFYTEDIAGAKLSANLYSYADLGAGQQPFYIIFNDYWMSGHRNTTTPIRFIGYKGSIKVVNEAYTVNTDCCHISKASGKDEIIIP